MWEEAARAPEAVQPAFSRTTGLRRTTSLAACRNRRPSSMLSTYPMITRVSGSSARNSRTSDSETSALFPMLTTLEKPMFSPIDRSRRAVHRAPDWERKPMFPFPGAPLEKEALRRAWVSITPRQFGPTTRIPEARATAVSSRSRVTPAPPTSLKPAEMAMAAFIPLAARAGNAFRMSFGATTKTPRSTGPGIASMDVNSGRPSSSPPPGFTP